MKTTATVLRESAIPARLVRSVVRQLGDKEFFRDIVRGGIDGGFHGFIYYSDTVAFFKRNREAIRDMAREQAQDFGQDVVSMVAGFRCLTDDYETRESIARCLFGGRLTDEDTEVANALAWYAAEEVARAFCDE